MLLIPSAVSFSTVALQTCFISGTTLEATALAVPKNSQYQSAASEDLLQLLQQKASIPNRELDDKINALVRILITTKSTFDPKECLDGPLFATVHFIGDTPLWEKIALGNIRNIKGQRYTLVNNTSGSFVNYAEICGKNLYLKAVGEFVERGQVTTLDEVRTGDQKASNNPWGTFMSLFSPRDKVQKKAAPYDYEAAVKGASVVLLGKYSFDVAIEGTGTVRVLYADPNLRIFLSPTDTDVTRGAGDWESAGLIVVQVRVGLVYDDWIDQTVEE